MYDYIRILKNAHITIARGLSSNEIRTIENIYGIVFPDELKKFFTTCLPISDGFYNWRDLSDANIAFIKNTMESFKDNMIQYINEIEWCDEWGNEPIEINTRNTIILNKIKSAPTLIPIYKHRAMPAINIKNTAVFSIVDRDIIYYGKNIIDYLRHEFGDNSKYSMATKYNYIDFWSDLC